MSLNYSRFRGDTVHPSKLAGMTLDQYRSFQRSGVPQRSGLLKRRGYVNNNTLQGVLGIQALQGSLEEFQQELRIVKSEQDWLCSASLDGALENLFELVNSVSKSDTDLLNLSGEKGFNASKLAQVSTAELLLQTEQLAKKMRETESKYSEQHDKVKALDSEVSHFSISEVTRCRSDIEVKIRAVETEIQEKCNEIHLADVEHRQTQTSISNLQVSINEASRRQAQHETARNQGIATSVVGGLTALGTIGLAIIFPPAGALAALAAGATTGGAITVSTIAGVVASEQDDNVDTQIARQAQFRADSGVQQAKLTRLEGEKREKEQGLSDKRSALASVMDVNNQLLALGVSFRTVRGELFALRNVFSSVQIKLGDLNRELEMCEFVESRKELATCLNDLLGGLIDDAGLDRNSVTVLQLRNGITGIVSRTDKIQEAFSKSLI